MARVLQKKFIGHKILETTFDTFDTLKIPIYASVHFKKPC